MREPTHSEVKLIPDTKVVLTKTSTGFCEPKTGQPDESTRWQACFHSIEWNLDVYNTLEAKWFYSVMRKLELQQVRRAKNLFQPTLEWVETERFGARIMGAARNLNPRKLIDGFMYRRMHKTFLEEQIDVDQDFLKWVFAPAAEELEKMKDNIDAQRAWKEEVILREAA